MQRWSRLRLRILRVRAVYIYFLGRWNASCMCVYVFEQANVFIRREIRTLTHQVININIAYLFMFSQFDFLLLLFCWLTAHTLSRTFSNLDQEQIYVQVMTLGRLANDAQKPLKNLFNSRKTFGTIYTYV